jgi:hypothetical protein
MEVRVRTRSVVAFFLMVGAVAAAAGPAAVATGRLSGLTQITYGCPGPVREGEPPCEHWSAFAHARFTVTRLQQGVPVAGSSRLVQSDEHGRFAVALRPGRYRVNPLRQEHTTGGAPLTVTIGAGATTRALVRFRGFPMML